MLIYKQNGHFKVVAILLRH